MSKRDPSSKRRRETKRETRTECSKAANADPDRRLRGTDECFQIRRRQLLATYRTPSWQAFCNLLAFYVAGLPAALADIPNCTTMRIKITQNIYKYVASLVRNQFRVERRLSQSCVLFIIEKATTDLPKLA